MTWRNVEQLHDGEIPQRKHKHSFAFKVSNSINKHSGKNSTDNLLVDTNATSHIISDISKFIAFNWHFDLSSHVIELADGSKANGVTARGTAKAELHDLNRSLHVFILNNVLHVPSYKQKNFLCKFSSGRRQCYLIRMLANLEVQEPQVLSWSKQVDYIV